MKKFLMACAVGISFGLGALASGWLAQPSEELLGFDKPYETTVVVEKKCEPRHQPPLPRMVMRGGPLFLYIDPYKDSWEIGKVPPTCALKGGPAEGKDLPTCEDLK